MYICMYICVYIYIYCSLGYMSLHTYLLASLSGPITQKKIYIYVYAKCILYIFCMCIYVCKKIGMAEANYRVRSQEPQKPDEQPQERDIFCTMKYDQGS